jgi:hypothetical protein
VEVDHDHHVAIRSKQFGIPAVGPVITPGDFGASVDKEFYGIFFVEIEVGRLEEKAFDFVIIRSGEPEGFQRGQGDLRENVFIQITQLDSAIFHKPDAGLLFRLLTRKCN